MIGSYAGEVTSQRLIRTTQFCRSAAESHSEYVVTVMMLVWFRIAEKKMCRKSRGLCRHSVFYEKFIGQRGENVDY
jgi:hypothetical protein